MNFLYLIKFIIFNKKKYKTKNSKKKILVEIFDYKADYITYSIFSNVLADIYDAELVGYYPTFLSYKRKIIILIKRIFFLNILEKVFFSFGCQKVLEPKKREDINNYNKFKSKKDLLNFKFKGLKIGDLIYDGFLREKNQVTININSEDFLNYFKNALKLTNYWLDYLKKSQVKAVIQSHNVYLTGILGRVACSLDIDVYNLSCYEVYYLNKKKPLKFNYFEDYPKVFKSLPKKIKTQGLINAKKFLSRRIKGKKDFLTDKSEKINKGTFEKNINFSFKFSKKPKILIAAHNFTDAPHVHEDMIFEDFYEWMHFIGKISNKLDNYQWLIKLHPVDYNANVDDMNNIIDKYKNLELLDKNINHNILKKQNIIGALTVYGSIAHEYPLFGIPVINAGNNPHFGYNFCYNPVTKKEYLKLINYIHNLKKFKKNISKIYEFYFMNFMFDYNLFEELKYNEEFLNSNKIFKYFFQTKMSDKLNSYSDLYKNFIKTKSRRMFKYND